MSELISEVSVNNPDHRGRFKQTIKRLANGEMDENELLNSLQGRSQEYIKRLIDEINGEACLLCIGMRGVSQDNMKANMLFKAVETLEAELLEGGYRNSKGWGGGSSPTDFPQENQEALTLPAILRTPQAMDYWRKLQKNGYVTSDFKPLGTKKQMALIAIEFSTAMGWKTKYKPFADLWGHNAKSMQEAVRRIRNGQREEWQVIIENIFRIQQNNNNTPTL